jgi:glycyl-radical enzyme activating protein
VALVFDIERFSTKDGPGVRTAVFFKGCNMRCLWCHNPEGIHVVPDLNYKARHCIACGRCAGACPNGAHRMSGGGHLFDQSKCSLCFACTKVCYTGALTQVGTDMTADEVMQEVVQDLTVYRKSGGGITLTGGEPMRQSDFAVELLSRCRALSVSTAIETNLYVPWEEYEKIIPFTNLFFVDLKHLDGDKHRKWTGVGNERILDNFCRLRASGAPFVLRTAVIPQFNDDEETVRTIALRAAGAENMRYFELLTYNPLGKTKEGIVRPPEIEYFAAPARKRMLQLAEAAAGCSVPTRLDGKGIGEVHG